MPDSMFSIYLKAQFTTNKMKFFHNYKLLLVLIENRKKKTLELQIEETSKCKQTIAYRVQVI